MKKKEILETFGQNAFGLLNQSQDDMDLMVRAHANLIALTAIQNGHNQHLLACFAAFVEAVGAIQEREVNDAVQDLLREVGINQS